MWRLVERHTGSVGYKAGIKANGLDAVPPVIDCSGWVALLLSTGMEAVNVTTGAEAFSAQDFTDVHTWSDRMTEVLERRSGSILEGGEIGLDTLPPYATVGLQQGGGAWAANHPRPRGITHVVQIVRRPDDGVPFVSEAQGWSEPRGLRLMSLADWLDATQLYLKPGKAWAVDAFAMQQEQTHGGRT
ncbi:hypothetical protein [Muricoccus nepalensis]|uniref:hypothetical protein n=1 Tax=Muricoccus nepalensis TaxID=1854500 RepID=UPI00112ED7D1|nr:hypothetical protein [Roseomonas nepalensis]